MEGEVGEPYGGSSTPNSTHSQILNSKSISGECWDAHELLGRDLLSQIYYSPVYLSRLKSKDICSFSHWITSVVIVDFDVNEGHRVAEEYPPNGLSSNEKERLMRMSLPDSNAIADAGVKFDNSSDHVVSLSDIKFCNQMNNGMNFLGAEEGKFQALNRNGISNNWLCLRLRHDSCLSLSHSSVSDQRFSIGAAIFRSVSDSNNRRNAKQEAVVLLSPLPISYFLPLLLPLSVFVANAYFVFGASAIYDACAAIGNWPFPRPSYSSILRLNVRLSMTSDSLQLEILPDTLSLETTQLPFPRSRTAARSPVLEVAKLFRLNAKKIKQKKNNPTVPTVSSFVRSLDSIEGTEKQSAVTGSNEISDSLSPTQSSSTTSTFIGLRRSTSPAVQLSKEISSSVTPRDGSEINTFCEKQRRWTPRAVVALWPLVNQTKNFDDCRTFHRRSKGTTRSESFSDNGSIIGSSHTLALTEFDSASSNEIKYHSDDEIQSVLSSISSMFAVDSSSFMSKVLNHRSLASSCASLSLESTHQRSTTSYRLRQFSFPNRNDSSQTEEENQTVDLITSSAPSLSLRDRFIDSLDSKIPNRVRHLPRSPLSLDSDSPLEKVIWHSQLGPGNKEIIPEVVYSIEKNCMLENEFGSESNTANGRPDAFPLRESKELHFNHSVFNQSRSALYTSATRNRTHLRKGKRTRGAKTKLSRLGYLKDALYELLNELSHRPGRVRTAAESFFKETGIVAGPSRPLPIPSLGLVGNLGPLCVCLWSLWEVMIIGAPFLILTSNGTRASSVVLALLNLIQPLHYGGDFRPYVNSFDPDLIHYRQSLEHSDPTEFPSVLIGASDPLLLSIFSCCPNVAVIEAPKSLFAPNSTPALQVSFRPRSTFPLNQNPFGIQNIIFRHDSSTGTASTRTRTPSRGGSTQLRTSWLKVASDGCIPKDAKLSKRLSDTLLAPSTTESPSFLENVGQIKSQLGIGHLGHSSGETDMKELEKTVTTYFYNLTLKFLDPFKLYVEPDLKNLMTNPLQETPQPLLFTPEAFLETIGSSSAPVFPPFSHLPRTKLVSLYRKFITTRTFRAWFCGARAAQQVATRRTQFSYCAAVNPAALFPRLSLNEATEGCAHLRHLLRESQNIAPCVEVAKVRALASELKKYIASSFDLSPRQNSRQSQSSFLKRSSLKETDVLQPTESNKEPNPSDSDSTMRRSYRFGIVASSQPSLSRKTSSFGESESSFTEVEFAENRSTVRAIRPIVPVNDQKNRSILSPEVQAHRRPPSSLKDDSVCGILSDEEEEEYHSASEE